VVGPLLRNIRTAPIRQDHGQKVDHKSVTSSDPVQQISGPTFLSGVVKKFCRPWISFEREGRRWRHPAFSSRTLLHHPGHTSNCILTCDAIRSRQADNIEARSSPMLNRRPRRFIRGIPKFWARVKQESSEIAPLGMPNSRLLVRKAGPA